MYQTWWPNWKSDCLLTVTPFLLFPQLWESLWPKRLNLFFPGFSKLGHIHTTDATDLWEQSLVQFSLTGLLFSYSQMTNWFKSCALEALHSIKVLYGDHQIPRERTQDTACSLGIKVALSAQEWSIFCYLDAVIFFLRNSHGRTQSWAVRGGEETNLHTWGGWFTWEEN